MAPGTSKTEMSSTVTPVTEGAATILFPSANEVFYNPVQQFNRDLSILAIRAWSKTYIKDRRTKTEQQQNRQTKRRKTDHDITDANGEVSAKSDANVGDVAVQMENRESARSTDQMSVSQHKAAPDAESGITHPDAETKLRITEVTEAGLRSGTAENPRDESIEVNFSILEALSATGLRAIRYAKEIPNLSFVTANDLSATAVEQIQRNSEHNATTALVRPNQGDARVVMYTTKKRYNVVDLDPYGSAAPFLDAAVQAVEDGGLMLITCTDLAVLAGDAHPEKCWSQYGGATIKQSDFCHEQALRMVLNTIATSAARYGRAITPLLSLSIDFYVRLFVRVDTSPAKVKHLMSNTMLTYQCSGCRSHQNQLMGTMKPGNKPELFKYSNASLSADQSCQHCGYTQHIGGPMYAGPIHQAEFIDQILEYAEEAEKSDTNVFGTIPRIKGMLSVAKEEILEPHHWSIARLTKVLHCQSPPQDKILSAILNAGYDVSGSHTGPRCIKTNAPASFMWDMLRAWILIVPIREESIKPNSPGAAILQRREPIHKVDFTYNPKCRSASKEQGLVRYQINPTENWGPKAKAGNTTKKTKVGKGGGGGNDQTTDKRKHEEI